MTEKEYGVVLITAPSRKEAEALARHLVESRLAACVNIISDIRSVYWWNDQLCDEAEVYLMAKTTRALFPELSEAVRSVHSYEVPEIIFLPIVSGYPAYLDWIEEVTK